MSAGAEWLLKKCADFGHKVGTPATIYTAAQCTVCHQWVFFR